MSLKKKELEQIKFRKIDLCFSKKNNILFFFSPLDLSISNFKKLKKYLVINNINVFMVKKTMFKNFLSKYEGSEQISFIFSGPVLVGILPILDYNKLSLLLDKKYNIYLLGFLFNQKLFGKTYLNQLVKLNQVGVYQGLISVLLHKQVVLSELLKIYSIKK